VDDDIIRGWGEIAQYLGFEIRTTQRYEHSRGLPIRRLPGSKGPVFALRSDLDRWRLGSQETAKLSGAAAPNLASLGSAELAAPALQRIYAMQEDTKLYRRDYFMRFDLRSFRSGIRAHIEYRYELWNATGARQPFIQEVTVDDSDNGHVETMSLSVGRETIYALKKPAISKRYLGWVTYRAPRQWIAPNAVNDKYVCRASWVIERGPNDIWYNHMILPTIGYKVESRAPAGFEITRSAADAGLVMKGEHRDIAWRRRTQP
jgi:hypothetical protein